MAYPYRGPWCSEVTFVPPDFRIEDCQAAAGINIANCSTAGQFPVTAVEREALRRDSGDTQGGMDLGHLRAGLWNRYGLDATYFGTLDSIKAALRGGWALDINGWLDAVPRKYWMQPFGAVYHAMSFNAGDKPDYCHLANPLAPKGHPGWEVPVSVALDFARSSASGRGGIRKGIYALGLSERPQSGPQVPADVTLPVSSETPVLVDLPKGKQLYDLGGNPLVPVSGAATGVRSEYELEASATRHLRVVPITTGGVRQLAAIANADANVRPIPVIDCAQAVAAEHERTLQEAKDALEAIP